MKPRSLSWLKDSFLPFVLIFVLGVFGIFQSNKLANMASEHYVVVNVSKETVETISGDSESSDEDDMEIEQFITPQFLEIRQVMLSEVMSLSQIPTLSIEKNYSENSSQLSALNNYFALQILKGNVKLSERLHDQIVAALESSVEKDKKTDSMAVVYNNLGFWHLKNSDYSVADKYFALSLNARFNFVSHFGYSISSLLQNKPIEFKRHFDAAERACPSRGLHLLYFEIGKTYYGLRQYEKSLEAFQKSHQLNAEFWPSGLGQANSLRKLSDYSPSEKLYSALLLKFPNNAKVHFSYGILLKRTGRLNDAIKEFHAALLSQSNYRQARKALASAYFDIKNYEKAYSQYKILSSRNLREPKYFYLMGKIDLILKNFEKAEKQFRKAIELRGGDYPDAWIKIADIKLELGRVDEARETLEALIRLRPEVSGAYLNLAEILEKQGQPDRTLELVKTAVKLKPSSHIAQRKLSALLEARGDSKAAILQLQEALSTDPENVTTLIRLGELYSRTHQYDLSNFQFKKVLKLNPSKSAVWYNYGLNLFEQKQFDDAIDSYTKALELSDQQDARFRADVLRSRASCKVKVGKSQSAIDDLNEALEIREEYSEVRVDLFNILNSIGTDEAKASASSLLREGLLLDPKNCQLRNIASLENSDQTSSMKKNDCETNK